MKQINLSQYEIEDLIAKLTQGESIPEDYKYKLFPTIQKEYELVYGGKMRREDVLANEDGVFPVPLQIEKKFNGKRKTWKDGWQNIIAFGDNLQFLKTIYENKDPLIKDKVKGKVKLIYIDPPFATESDFQASEGQKAYTDKTKGAEFVEFLRKRLIVAREILSDEGAIFVHLDWKKAHYIKLIMDEVFGENNFRNEIIWGYRRWSAKSKGFQKSHDVIFYYSKTPNFLWNDVIEAYADGGAHFTEKDKDGEYRWQYLNGKKYKLYKKAGTRAKDWWDDIPYINSMAKERVNYPTQKPENLIKRIIEASTNKGDLVMDFFAGSGVVATVSEKMNRRYISCDIGKLSFYTTQKRILNISDTRDLLAPQKEKKNLVKCDNCETKIVCSKQMLDAKKLYKKEAKSFITVNTGQYDLEKVFNLKNEEYSNFVLNLFEIEPIKKTISGIKINGERKDGYYALIWPYWEFKEASIDEEYLNDLHSNIGKKIGDRIYIVAPASYVDFISDYYEIDNIRYYFLKVPYHIIKELHKVQFKKFRQPQSKKNVNDLEDAIGFHFMKQPEVETKDL